MKQKHSKSSSEDINFSRIMQGKRSLANSEGTLLDLKSEAKMLFKAFYNAKEDTNKMLEQIPIKNRLGSIQAQLLQCFLAKYLEKYFPNNFLKRQNRLIVHINGYLILFKKLNTKGYPMNIKTDTIDAIVNQLLKLNLYENDDLGPILHFGYEVNKVGDLINPRIIYLDEDILQFSLSEENFNQTVLKSKLKNDNDQNSDVSPKLKKEDTDDNSEVI